MPYLSGKENLVFLCNRTQVDHLVIANHFTATSCFQANLCGAIWQFSLRSIHDIYALKLIFVGEKFQLCEYIIGIQQIYIYIYDNQIVIFWGFDNGKIIFLERGSCQYINHSIKYRAFYPFESYFQFTFYKEIRPPKIVIQRSISRYCMLFKRSLTSIFGLHLRYWRRVKESVISKRTFQLSPDNNYDAVIYLVS